MKSALQTSHIIALAMLFPLLTAARAHGADAGKLDFNRDVQPILSDNCYLCHGTDKNQRKANLRLDSFAEATRVREKGVRPVVPGKSAESDAIRRLLSTDPDEVMPPKDSHREVTAAQIEILKKWIDQGAEYAPHWAFIPPKRAELPKVSDPGWVRNPIDAFILARLDKEGLKPSPEASKDKLIRRVTLDLIGLPPTPEEVDAFVADTSSDAYERVVDRLLASPEYGERMVIDWLDASRYADTNGYQGDPTRTSWPWRDWVVNAMNANMPFDQFVTEQLAGDLIPNHTMSQQLATSFNRNHTFNGEGGRIADETRVENVMDRTETFGTVFLGLTVGCTRCHDHKYDPLTQQEYYKLYAYFNNSSETGKFDYVPGTGNVQPVISYTTPEQDAKLALLQAGVKETEAKLSAALPQIDIEQKAWEQKAAEIGPPAWTVLRPSDMTAGSGATLTRENDDSVIADGILATTDMYEVTLKTGERHLTGLRLEVLGHSSLPAGGPGRAVNGNFVLTGLEAEATSTKDANVHKPVAFRAGAATAEFSQTGWDVNGAIDADPKTGWAVMGAPKRELIAAVFPFAEPVDFKGGATIRLKLRQHYTGENAGGPAGQHLIGRFRLSLTSGAIVPADVSTALSVVPDKRNEAQIKLIASHYRKNVSTAFRPLNDAVESARKAVADFEKDLVKVMVMNDAMPRETHLLTRGAYDKPVGDKLGPGTPAVLNKMPDNAPKNRLGLARWLLDPANPLTARVAVNRYWQLFFGTGIVKTVDDFGLQGEKPNHPELLDWLAVEFQSKWNVKAMHRLIVTSSTYRQSSKVTPELVEKDPANRLLARGPRYRLSSFQIRDQALAISGLLVDKMGGPPVRPYQPPGVWEEMSLDQIKYTPDKGDSLYRRSLYTFWRRTVAPTTMFDVPARTVCSVRHVRTNTPLQALALLNDTTYVEAARVLAEKLLLDKSKSDEQRFERIFRLATSRKLTSAEKKVMTASLARLRDQYAMDQDGAKKLISVGEKPHDKSLDAGELASWTTVVSMVMNLDETITQE